MSGLAIDRGRRSERYALAVAALMLAFALAPAHLLAADLCAPIENLRPRDIPEAKALYRACREGNELFDRVNADLGIRAMFSAADAETFVGRGVDAASEKKALAWNGSVNVSVRQCTSAKELIEKAVREVSSAADPETGDPRRQARLEASAAAIAKVAAKGENLKRYLLLQTEKIRSAYQLEQALKRFYDEEPLVFRAPAAID